MPNYGISNECDPFGDPLNVGPGGQPCIANPDPGFFGPRGNDFLGDPGHDIPIPPDFNDGDPGFSLPSSFCTGTNGNLPSLFSSGPIRYFDGVAKFSVTDLESDGFGAPWIQVRSWSNATVYSAGYSNGNGWVDSQFPTLRKINSNDYHVIAIVSNGTTARFFDDPNATSTSGNYTERFDGKNKLSYDPSASQYVLTTPSGMTFRFANFSASNAGFLASRIDAYGNAVSMTYSSGKIATVTRGGSAEGSSITETWTYDYISSGANAGLLSAVTLARGPNGGTMTTVRKVAYDYYGSSDDNGNLGDLKTAIVTDASNATLGTQYYRYYKSGQSHGFAHALKFAFTQASYDRLAQACADASTTVDSALDSFVDDYADLYFEFDSGGRVSLERVQGAGCSACTGGLGEYSFTYESSNNSAGFNSWAVKTTETLPDGNKNIIYTNTYAEVMLRVFAEYSGGSPTGNKWDTFYQYDGNGRVILMADTSAITGYGDSYADLLHATSGNYQYLSDSVGLLARYRYGTSTTAQSSTPGDVTGYWQGVDLLHGETGTPQPQFDIKYFEMTQNSLVLHPEAQFVEYASVTSGVGGNARTTSYSYTFFSNTAAIETTTVMRALISTGQNGPGGTAYDVQKGWADRYGRLIWSQDGDGYVNYWEFGSPAAPVPTKIIVDADTTQTGDFAVSVPSGLTSPSGTRLRLTTLQEFDSRGGVTKLTTPEGRITYVVYNYPNHEVRAYPGWNTSTSAPTGPTTVIRDDRSHSYVESLTMSAAPATSSGVPTGTESISSVQTLTRTYVNTAGQAVQTDAFFNLTSLTYTTSTSLGTINTNFYRTLQAYDNRGRPNRTELPTGTIYRTVYDGLDRTVSTWIGTDDTPSSGYWSPTNLTGTNTVQTGGFVYDVGGIGDGNLTQESAYPSGGAADRVTQHSYDWRDRLIATKQGVETTESTSLNRPIFYVELNNLGETVYSERYDGDTVSITTDSNSDGVPDRPSSSLLRGKTGFDIDDQGRVYRTKSYAVNPSNGTEGNALTSQNWFDHRGNLLKTVVPGAISTKYIHDGAGRVTFVYTSDGGGDNDAWDQAHDVIGDIVFGQVETSFDSDGLPIRTTTRQRFHDDSTTGALVDISTSPKARVSFSTAYYDFAMRTTATVDVGTNGGSSYTRPSSVPSRSDTVLVGSLAYNDAGWVSSVTDPRALETRTSYDNLGRVTQTIEGYVDGTPSAQDDKTTQFTYDGSNHVLTYTLLLPSSAFQTTQYVYGYTSSTITSNDLLKEVRHPDKSSGSASTSEKDLYTYDALSEVLTFQDRNGSVHTHSRDVLGRLTADAVTTLGSGVDGSVRRLETAYDSQGNPYLFTSYSASSGGTVVNQVQRAFDARGQLTTEWQEHTGAVNTSTSSKVQYAYAELTDSSGMFTRLVSITYPDGKVIDYNYGASTDLNYRISRLTALIEHSTSTHLEDYQYLGLGTVVQRAHPQPGDDMTFIASSGTGDAGDKYVGLDRFGRVVDLRWKTSSTDLDRFKYGYDRDSNRLFRTNEVNHSFDELYHANGATNGYDGLNQLTDFRRGTLTDANSDGVPDTVTTASRSQGWTLDAAGNFSTVTTNGTGTNRTYNKQNETTAVGSTNLAFDSNGNTTSDDSGRPLAYDAWNRLISIRNGSFLHTYAYDALDRRLSEVKAPVFEAPTTTYRDLYYNAVWQVIEERKGATPVTDRHYVWSPAGIDLMVLRDFDSDNNGSLDQRLYVQQDAQGNVTALVNTSGSVVERSVEDPYGVVTVLTGSWGSRSATLYDWKHYHQGLRLDGSGTLYDNRMRMYSPTLMRFLQNDPIGFMGGDQNTYRYVGNGPTSYLDPVGMNRRIAVWFSHGYIEILNPDGSITQLHFGYQGYVVVNGPPLAGSFPISPWHSSTPEQDQLLIALWYALERDRRAGNIPSWLIDSWLTDWYVNWLYNCWTPVFLFFDWGIPPTSPPPLPPAPGPGAWVPIGNGPWGEYPKPPKKEPSKWCGWNPI